MKKIILFFITLALMLGPLGSMSSEAIVLTPSPDLNYDILTNVGDPIVDAWPEEVWTSSGSTLLAMLTGRVFEYDPTPGAPASGDEIYTYELMLDPEPGTAAIKEFNTGFPVEGFVANKAGYSFSDVYANMDLAAYAEYAIEVAVEDDGTIDFNTHPTFVSYYNLWNNGYHGSIRFFYQSTIGPGNGDNYNIFNGLGGSGENYYPHYACVPEPPTVFLILSCLIGLGLLVKKSKKMLINKNTIKTA